jgi:hypothetical protein
MLALGLLLSSVTLQLQPAQASAAPTPSSTAASFPDRLGTPIWGGPTVNGSPAGPASVVFGARNWWWDGSAGDLAVVGAIDDRYRTVHVDEGDHAGEQALLSPDGSQLVMTGRVVDLSTGKMRALPQLDGVAVTPQAWAPDGQHLAVLAKRLNETRQTDGSLWPTPIAATLYILDLATGQHTRLDALRTPFVYDGLTVAFAPSGDRVVYQSSDMITVATLDGGVQSRFTVAGATRLAGKGAWAPDGHLVLLTQQQCCTGDAYPVRWHWQVVDPTTGQQLEHRHLPEMAGLVTIRLLGWAPNGAAVAAASYPEPNATVVPLNSGTPFQLTDYQPIRTVAILALAPDAPPQTLLTVADEVALNIDIADHVIATGTRRPGQPPTGLSPYLRIGLAVAFAIALLVVAAAVILIVTLRRTRRSTRPLPA